MGDQGVEDHGQQVREALGKPCRVVRRVAVDEALRRPASSGSAVARCHGPTLTGGTTVRSVSPPSGMSARVSSAEPTPSVPGGS
ncbi:hypothetical protein ACIQNG_20965 [Streptomyces sp. NPDC091377]|uniref:hypothetical protein n=1 Tax=Streptomyces sp. NPDC091377 TaxID=3365995 RepID=UPI0037FDF0AC